MTRLTDKQVRELRSSELYRETMRAALRDNPICADPFGYHERAGVLVPSSEVHHIQTVAAAPGLRLDASNLVCLCPLCHSAIHRKRSALRTILRVVPSISGTRAAMLIELARGSDALTPDRQGGVESQKRTTL